jgi:hypothetical protein
MRRVARHGHGKMPGGTRDPSLECVLVVRRLVVRHAPAHRKEHLMLDVILLAIGLGFFALSVGYTIACDRL